MTKEATQLQSRPRTIAIAADHNGVEMKIHLIAVLTEVGYVVHDRGTNGSEIVDYPFLCADVGSQVLNGQVDRGIIIGGSGMGEHIACNKLRGIRAGLCRTIFDVEISRGNNDSNILILGAKIIENKLAAELCKAWLTLPFKGGIHQQRIDQIAKLEDGTALGLLPGGPT